MLSIYTQEIMKQKPATRQAAEEMLRGGIDASLVNWWVQFSLLSFNSDIQPIFRNAIESNQHTVEEVLGLTRAGYIKIRREMRRAGLMVYCPVQHVWHQQRPSELNLKRKFRFNASPAQQPVRQLELAS